jgi:hypothetical protein
MSVLFQTGSSSISPRRLNRGRRYFGVALKSFPSVWSAVFNGPSRSLMLPQKFHEVLLEWVWKKVLVHGSVFLENFGD